MHRKTLAPLNPGGIASAAVTPIGISTSRRIACGMLVSITGPRPRGEKSIASIEKLN